MKSRLEAWIFILLTIIFAMYIVDSTQNTAMEVMVEQSDKLTIIKPKSNKNYLLANTSYYIDSKEDMYIDVNILKNDLHVQFIYDMDSDMGILTTPYKVIRFKNDGVYVNNTVSEYPNLVDASGKKYLCMSAFKDIIGIEIKVTDKGISLRSKLDEYLAGSTTNKYPIRLKERKSIFSNITHIINGMDIQIMAEEGKWIHIMLEDGTYGYIRKRDLETYEHIKKEEIDQKPSIWSPDYKIVLSWEYDKYGRLDSDKIGNLESVNVTSPTWFSIVNGKGTIKTKINKNYIEWAKDREYQVWPLINNSFNPDITHEFLSSASTRERIINELLKYLKDNDVDGINIDFENIYVKDKGRLVQFMRELIPVFNQNNLVVSMDVTVIGGSDNWSRCFDRKELGKVLDYMAVMTYDEHWASSPKAGSVASIGWVEKSINRIKRDVPKEKLLVGVPFYTRVWTETTDTNGKVKLVSKAVSMQYVNNLIAKKGLEKSWLDNKGQYYVEYKEGDKRYRIWVEDKRSIELKARLVNKLDVSGMATWRRGFETSDIWPVIENVLN